MRFYGLLLLCELFKKLPGAFAEFFGEPEGRAVCVLVEVLRVDQRGLPKLLEHGYARPQVLRVARRLGTNNQRPKAGGTFIDVQLKGAFQYPTSSRGPEGCYKSVNCNVKPSTASPLRILR